MPVGLGTIGGAVQELSDVIERARAFLERHRAEVPLAAGERVTLGSLTSALASLMEADAFADENRRSEARRLYDELTRINPIPRHPLFAIANNGTPVGLQWGEDGRLEQSASAFNIAAALDVWTPDLNGQLLQAVLYDMGFTEHSSETQVPLLAIEGGMSVLNPALFPDNSHTSRRLARNLAEQLEAIHYTLKELGIGKTRWDDAYVVREAGGQPRIFLGAEENGAVLLDANPLADAYRDRARFDELRRARVAHPFITNMAAPTVRGPIYEKLAMAEIDVSHAIANLGQRGRLPMHNKENSIRDLIEGLRLYVSARGAEHRELLQYFDNKRCVDVLKAIIGYYIDALRTTGVTNFTVLELFEIMRNVDASRWLPFAEKIIDEAYVARETCPSPADFNMHAYWVSNYKRILKDMGSDHAEENPIGVSRLASRRHTRLGSVGRSPTRHARRFGGLGIRSATRVRTPRH